MLSHVVLPAEVFEAVTTLMRLHPHVNLVHVPLEGALAPKRLAAHVAVAVRQRRCCFPLLFLRHVAAAVAVVVQGATVRWSCEHVACV